MRWFSSLAASLALVATGCDTTDPDIKPRGPLNESHRAVNEAMFQQYNLEAMDNAIIRQHTLYPYHFVAHSDQLNALGRREVFVLAHHYQRYPGPLNVRRGSESDSLYRARVQRVMETMVDGGVAASQLKIEDGMPGGEGISSDQVVVVLERMQDSELSAQSGRPSGTSATGAQDESGAGSSNEGDNQ